MSGIPNTAWRLSLVAQVPRTITSGCRLRGSCFKMKHLWALTGSTELKCRGNSSNILLSSNGGPAILHAHPFGVGLETNKCLTSAWESTAFSWIVLTSSIDEEWSSTNHRSEIWPFFNIRVHSSSNYTFRLHSWQTSRNGPNSTRCMITRCKRQWAGKSPSYSSLNTCAWTISTTGFFIGRRDTCRRISKQTTHRISKRSSREMTELKFLLVSNVSMTTAPAGCP